MGWRNKFGFTVSFGIEACPPWTRIHWRKAFLKLVNL